MVTSASTPASFARVSAAGSIPLRANDSRLRVRIDESHVKQSFSFLVIVLRSLKEIRGENENDYENGERLSKYNRPYLSRK